MKGQDPWLPPGSVCLSMGLVCASAVKGCSDLFKDFFMPCFSAAVEYACFE